MYISNNIRGISKITSILALFVCSFVVIISNIHAEKIAIKNIGLVSEDILCLTIEEGVYIPGEFVPYVKKEGDVIEKLPDVTWLIRNNEKVGFLAGPNQEYFRGYDRVVGDRLNESEVSKASNYLFYQKSGDKFIGIENPVAIYKKIKMLKIARTGAWAFDCPRRFYVFIKFKNKLSKDKTYKIEFKNLNMAPVEFSLVPENMRSEAVHVNHLGFAVNSPVKIAFLSCWMGDGGQVNFKAGTSFYLIDEKNHQKVFSGRVEISRKHTENECGNKNYSGRDVFQMQFNEFNTPGRYRVYVENIGCSYPFDISNDVWEKAFLVSTKGILNNRSGITLGPPYTEFKRPRPMHPEDGVKIWAASETVFHGDDHEGFLRLVNSKLDYTVDNAWGGLMDAGDWDRRTFHLVVSRNLIELCLLFPDYFNTLNTNIPESNNDLPDLIDEALFNLDCYKRMQLPDGGVRGGIESASHPKYGEPSWLESQIMFAYAPDVYSSFEFAATAARVAYWFSLNNRVEKSEEYKNAALKAYTWADSAFAANPDFHKREARDSKNLAAAELFRLTGEAKFNNAFLETTVYKSEQQLTNIWETYDQQEAPFVYLITQRRGKDPKILQNCKNSLLNQAYVTIECSSVSGFKWAKNYYAPMGFSNASTPQEAPNLLRCFYITRDIKYLKAAILISQAGLGANPLNATYTTGLGHDYPHFPLHVDSYVTGQPAPAGITIYGPLDQAFFEQGWWCNPIFDSDQLNVGRIFVYPKFKQWPPFESYFDMGLWNPLMSEYTVMQNHAYVTYTWGYLSAYFKQ
ncbi:MAG: glycoside hydrolase family 9 protein [Cytophagaceae bacterium]|nr:glycoside hydrolase family 9 protein [Cytophagaceae bacterium]MDW8455683.1 glycoside hydrolase family 9 protein [Cytophagaceae bacterium]